MYARNKLLAEWLDYIQFSSITVHIWLFLGIWVSLEFIAIVFTIVPYDQRKTRRKRAINAWADYCNRALHHNEVNKFQFNQNTLNILYNR